MSSDLLISFWDIQKLFLFLPQVIKVDLNEKLLEKYQLKKKTVNIIAICISVPLLIILAWLSTKPFVKVYFGIGSWLGVVLGFLFVKGTIAFVVVKLIRLR